MLLTRKDFSIVYYDMPLYRPPSEARSLIFQVTLGCSHNRCAYCVIYRTKKFRIRPWDELKADIEEAAVTHREARRIFLADGDAMAVDTDYMVQILELLYEMFPHLERVSAYNKKTPCKFYYSRQGCAKGQEKCSFSHDSDFAGAVRARHSAYGKACMQFCKDGRHCKSDRCCRIHNEQEQGARIMETDDVCEDCGSIVEWFRGDCKFCGTKRGAKRQSEDMRTVKDRRPSREEKVMKAGFTLKIPTKLGRMRSEVKRRAWSTTPRSAAGGTNVPTSTAKKHTMITRRGNGCGMWRLNVKIAVKA